MKRLWLYLHFIFLELTRGYNSLPSPSFPGPHPHQGLLMMLHNVLPWIFFPKIGPMLPREQQSWGLLGVPFSASLLLYCKVKFLLEDLSLNSLPSAGSESSHNLLKQPALSQSKATSFLCVSHMHTGPKDPVHPLLHCWVTSRNLTWKWSSWETNSCL